MQPLGPFGIGVPNATFPLPGEIVILEVFDNLPVNFHRIGIFHLLAGI